MDIELEVGTLMQLQLGSEPDAPRYVSRIIGYVDKSTIILRSPQVDGKSLLMREGQLLTARFMGSSKVYAFSSHISAVILRPFPHIHIEYPSRTESAYVRRSERVETDIEATVILGESDTEKCIQTLIIDLSASGALIRCSEDLGEVGEEIKVSMGVEYKNNIKRVSFPAIIRNVLDDSPETGEQALEASEEDPDQNDNEDNNDKPVLIAAMKLYGVEFKIGGFKDHLMVKGLVYSQTVQSH